MLADVIGLLACPVCDGGLAIAEGAVRCPKGHAYDIARQGYVNLLTTSAVPGTADTPPMVAARDAFLHAGHYLPLADALAEACGRVAAGVAGCVLEVGAGTGYYLAHVLDAMPGRVGLALDISKHAARRAAVAHPRIGAVVCDAWRGLPVADGAAALVLDVFAPRNAAEMARILAPEGTLLVVTPTARHLAEAAGPLGMLDIDPDKPDRLAAQLAERFHRTSERVLEWRMELDAGALRALAGMGPSAHHTAQAVLEERLNALATPIMVTASVTLGMYQAH